MEEIDESKIFAKLQKKDSEERKQRPVCREFVMKRFCKFGDNCRYQHTLDLAIIKLTPCKFGVGCRRQARCPFGHNEEEHQDIDDIEYLCGMCYSNIVKDGKRFGLIKCGHIFCYDCIRRWKRESASIQYGHRSWFDCPYCKTQCCPIIPSYIYVKDEFEKECILKRRRQTCKNKPCKYGQRRQYCPFKQHCHYQHID